MASSDLHGEVSASTRNSPGAPAESPVKRRTVRETGCVSDRVHTRKRPQRTQPKTDAGGTCQDNPIAGPRTGTTGSEPSTLPWRGPATGTMSPVLGRPPRAPRSRPVKSGAQAPGIGKGTTASRKPTGAPRATGPDEARRTTRGHEARQRGTRPATTKAQGQVPSNNGCRVPQTRRARTTRNEPRHENRCQAIPSGIRMDECAPGGYPAPAGYEQPPSGWTSARPAAEPAPAGYEQPPSGWTSARLEGTQALPATNSRRPDGGVCAPQ